MNLKTLLKILCDISLLEMPKDLISKKKFNFLIYNL